MKHGKCFQLTLLIFVYVLVQKLGCFRDRIRWPVFPSYKDLRDQIDWSDLSKTVEQCGNFTLSKGLKVSMKQV